MKPRRTCTYFSSFRGFYPGYLGVIVGEKPYFYNATTRKHTAQSSFDISKIDELPQVDIIYGYQNSEKSSYMYEAAVQAGVKGIIIAAPGNGSLSNATRDAALSAQKKGVTIVRSSRVGNGVVNRLSTDDKNNFVAADSLNPVKARILLMLALTQTDDPKKIQEFFNEY